MFLVGKGIPSHITSLPQTILNTPFGQMLKPQLDNAMRGVTQVPVDPVNILRSSGTQNGTSNGKASGSKDAKAQHQDVPGIVYHPKKADQLDELLKSARDSCAIIFFTSATCPPCKLVYPAYDELAASAGQKAVLIKVDLSEAYEIGARYQVRVTPTFMTFLKGQKENEWTGANESQLRGNVQLLIQMAHPPHPHMQLRLPTLRRPHEKSVTYPKVPPLDKIVAKLGATGTEPAVKALQTFNRTRAESGAVDAPLPSLPSVSELVVRTSKSLPPEILFPLVDLFRLALVDPRVSGYFAQDTQPVQAILTRVEQLDATCPYQLTIVTLHMACNLFTSPLFLKILLSDVTLSPLVFQLVTSSLLDATHAQVRVVAAQLAFNIAAVNHNQRLNGKEDMLSESSQVELMAGLLEALRKEGESVDVVRALFLAIGLLKFLAPADGELSELCEAVGARDLVNDAKGKYSELRDLAQEVHLVMS